MGVDFGTSNTVAALSGIDGRVRVLLFDGSPLLASAVLADPDGVLLTGADAVRVAVGHPAGLEANPKQRIDDGVVWLADREIPVTDAIAAVLRRVADEATRVAGGPVRDMILTHPAAWGAARTGVLTAAAAQVGWERALLVAEPVAAATYFAAVLAGRVRTGRYLVIYDLGAGTFDVTVVRRSMATFEVVATDGLDDVGGPHPDTATTDARDACVIADAARTLPHTLRQEVLNGCRVRAFEQRRNSRPSPAAAGRVRDASAEWRPHPARRDRDRRSTR